MPRIVTCWPVPPRVTVGALDAPAPGSSPSTGATEPSDPTALPVAAAFKKCLRLDPPPHTSRDRSLMVHLARLPSALVMYGTRTLSLDGRLCDVAAHCAGTITEWSTKI